MAIQEPHRTLRLMIEVPGLWADDLEATAADLDVSVLDLLEEEIRLDVGITIVTLPGEKCMNDDFGITVHVGHVVDASVVLS